MLENFGRSGYDKGDLKGGETMKRITKLIVAALIGVLGIGCFAACGSTRTTIRVSGSSSVSPLIQKLAAEYEKTHNVRILVTTSDSSTGVKDTQEGKNDLGMASRNLKDGEESVEAIKICDDGVVLVVNNESTLTDVTMQQVYDLYANGTAIGDVTNAVSREEGSGTRDAFDDLIANADGGKLKDLKEFSDRVSIQNSTGNVMLEVAGNPNMLGYISLGSLDDTVKALTFGGTAATAENIKNGTYKLSRSFNLVKRAGEDLSAEAQGFVDFILSEEGQAIMLAEGYVA